MLKLLHIKIRFPIFLHASQNRLQKSNVDRAKRFTFERHFSLLWGAIAFLDVALITGRHQVLPGIAATTAFGHHMIDSQIPRCSAILALLGVPLHNIMARKDNLIVRNIDVAAQPNDRRIGIFLRNSPNRSLRIVVNHLSFIQEKQFHRAMHRANA